MPRLVFQVIPRSNENPLMDCRCFKMGDLIELQPDGFRFSKTDRTNPEWRIVDTPLPWEEAAALMAEEEGDHLENPYLRIRPLYIQIDLLPPGIAQKMRGKHPGAAIVIGTNALRKAIRRRDPIRNPQVMG